MRATDVCEDLLFAVFIMMMVTVIIIFHAPGDPYGCDKTTCYQQSDDENR